MIGPMILFFLIGFLAGVTAMLAYCWLAARGVRAISRAWEEGIAEIVRWQRERIKNDEHRTTERTDINESTPG